MEMPSIRSSRGTRTGQAGGYFGAQLYDVRRITSNGHIFSATIAEVKAKRRAIQEALPLFPTQITMRIVDDGGQVYLIYCQVMDFKMPITRFLGKAVFKIELEASDPVIYDDTAGSALTATVNQLVPGGVLFSSISPAFGSSFLFSGDSPAASINNSSELASLPVITINGAVTDPVLENTTTGEVFRLTGYAVGAGSVTVIDMQARTVTLNGGNVFAYAPLDTDWWALVPGENNIKFTTGGGSASTAALLAWRPGYSGI